MQEIEYLLLIYVWYWGSAFAINLCLLLIVCRDIVVIGVVVIWFLRCGQCVANPEAYLYLSRIVMYCWHCWALPKT